LFISRPELHRVHPESLSDSPPSACGWNNNDCKASLKKIFPGLFSVC
jgi:hypothetical protein